MKTKEQIIEWLKSHALYDAFAKNISPKTVEEVIEHLLKERKGPDLIASAFFWASTDEGYEFWDNSHLELYRWFNSNEQTEPSSDRWIFDRGSKEAPFYMVQIEGRPTRPQKYPLMVLATKAADRLAKSLNTKTYVLAAVMEIRPEMVTSAVGIDNMEHHVDNPL